MGQGNVPAVDEAGGEAPPPDPKSPSRIRYVHADVIPVAVPETSAVRPPFSMTVHVVVVSVMSTATHELLRRSDAE